MDFSLPHVIVVPSANSLPTTGSTQDLDAGQVGIFLNTYAAGTAANIANAPYIYIAQGRQEKSLPSLRSDKISKDHIIEWSKVRGSATAANEIWEISDFSAKCGEDLTVTINAHSFYIDTAFYNGLTRSVTIKTPCCDCGADPCTEVDAEALVDSIIAKLGEDFSVGRQAASLTQFFDFEKIGSGAGTKLRISAKSLTKYGQPCDMAAFPHMFDRLWFRPFVYIGPATTSDFITADSCETNAGVTTLVQRSTYAKLTSDEVAQLEKDNYSYKVDRFKEIFRFQGYTPFFESYVEDGVVYNQYLIEFHEPASSMKYTWEDVARQDERVILLVPNSISNIETVLTAYLGAPKAVDSTPQTTTTTTSTSSTTTTTTTVAVP